MAWVIQNDFAGFGTTPLDIEPPERERLPTRDEARELGLHYSKYGVFHCGNRVPDRFWPKRAISKTKRKSYPHILTWQVLAFSQELRDLVEELDPGVHEFRLMPVVPKPAGAVPLPFYAVNIMMMVDGAIDFERTEAPSKIYGDRREILPLRDSDSGRVCISKAKVANKNLWITEEIVGRPITLSNQLYELLRQRKMAKGYKAFELKEI